VSEDELLKLPFEQIGRMFEGLHKRKEERTFLTREIGWLIHAYHDKSPKPKNIWWPIGETESTEPTKEYLDQVWKEHGKLKRIKRKKLWRLKKN